MNDASMKAVLGAGLLAQAAAVAAGFTSAGWHWPIAGATAAVGLGILVVLGIEKSLDDALGRGVARGAGLAMGAAAGQASSASPAAAWITRTFFGVEFLFQLALLLFHLKRLW
ncbi:MAG TPA: hypothetical protein VE981_12320 [Planctomycetota bacterium]|nr:hypothetical protein [Planctomycetota bacterium]